jgi:hypothetical protein
LFRYFILNVWGTFKEENKNIDNLIENFSKDNYLEYFQSKNEYNLFKQFKKFFSDNLNKILFFETIKEFNLDEKKLNVFLNVWEYLENIANKQEVYSNDFYDVTNNYKDSIWTVLINNSITQKSSVLLQNWFSGISPFDLIIDDCNFENNIDYQMWNSFLWCKDMWNNIFYQNRNWEILKDWQGKIITNIETKTIKYFWDFRVFSFENEDWEKKIQIENEIELIPEFKNNIIWNSFNVVSIWYKEKLEDEEWILRDFIQNYDFLLINDNEWRRLLNKNLEEITVLDLLRFLNRNNDLMIKTIEETLDRLEEVDVSNIYRIHNLNWIRLIECQCNIDLSHWYDETEIEEELKDVIFLYNWKVLVDENDFWKVYIKSLGEIVTILWKDFVEFSLTDVLGVDWYIDGKWDVLKIWWHRVTSIKKSFSFLENSTSINKPKQVYTLNNNNELVFFEDQILKDLSKYNWFNEVWDQFELIMEKWEFIEIDNIKYKKIIWIFNEEWVLNFYLEWDSYKYEVDYNFLLDNLRKNDLKLKTLSILNRVLKKYWL